ncbi:12856_t:CDS:2, partial [Gigaspora margarita]
MQIFNLANDKGAQNVMFGIFPEENNIIIHIFEEDIETNQAFINATVEQYGPKIIIQPREALSNTKINSRNETEFYYDAWDKQPTNYLVGLMLPKVNE